MHRRSACLLLLVLVVAVASVLALRTPPVAAGEEPESAKEAKPYLTTRYRVTVVSLELKPGARCAPLTFSDLAERIPGAVVPQNDDLAAAGHFGALPCRSDYGLTAPGVSSSRVLFSGEVEELPRRKCSIVQGQRFPVESVQIRGDSKTVTTMFEKVGFTMDITALGSAEDGRPGVPHQARLEFSVISAFGEGGAPVISTFSTQGTIALPDAYTAFFSFVDRVPGEVLRRSRAVGETETPADVVVQYLVLVTRMDLTK